MDKNLAILYRDDRKYEEQLQYLEEGINTIIVMIPAECHHFCALANSIYDSLTKNKVRKNVKIIFVGNFTNDYNNVNLKMNGYKYNTILVPFPHTPFDIFTYHKQKAHFPDVVEQNNTKDSKVSFIYYGHRVERDVIVCELYKRNLLQNTIYHSDWKQDRVGKTVYSQVSDFDEIGYKDFHTYEKVKNLLPKKIEKYHSNDDNFYPRTIEIASKSLFYIVAETNVSFGDNINVATEKSAIPFFSKSIPAFITGNSLDAVLWFENLGFDCFTDIIPYKIYELDLLEKIQNIIQIIEQTDIDFFERNIDRFNKNYQLAKKLVNSGDTTERTIEYIIKKYNLNIVKEFLK